MPNWCYNELTVTGNETDVRRFITELNTDGKVLSEDTLIPYPAKYRILDEIAKQWDKDNPGAGYIGRPIDGFNSGGYEWCIDNYGSKWGFCNPILVSEGFMTGVDTGKYYVQYQFDSAWNPPNKLILKMGVKYPMLHIELVYEIEGEKKRYMTVDGKNAKDKDYRTGKWKEKIKRKKGCL